VRTYEKATAAVAAADRGRNRRDVPLTHASLPHMTTREVIVVMTPKSKRQDMTLRHCAGRSVGSELEAAQVPRDRVSASGRMAVASQIGLEAGTSRDGR
jgi:hypothetical protein